MEAPVVSVIHALWDVNVWPYPACFHMLLLQHPTLYYFYQMCSIKLGVRSPCRSWVLQLMKMES